MNNLKHLTVIYCLIGLGLGFGSLAEARPSINLIDGKSTASTVWLNKTDDISLSGSGAGAGQRVTITVDGSDVAYYDATTTGHFYPSFSTDDSAGPKYVRAKAGGLTSWAKAIDWDFTPPTVSFTWKSPTENKCMDYRLSEIKAENSDDTGGSGIDTGRGKIWLSPSVSYDDFTTSGNDFIFNPKNGYPDSTHNYDFAPRTQYRICATVFDNAGNSTTSDAHPYNFCYLGCNPVPHIKFASPNRNHPPSYYMGEGLTTIYADLGCSSCNPAVIRGDSSMTISPSPSPTAGNYTIHSQTITWDIGGTYETNFEKDELYTISVYVWDNNGKYGTDVQKFMKDEDCPVIEDFYVMDADTPPKGVDPMTNDIVMSGGFFQSCHFYSNITDTPLDWGGHTSLNGSGTGNVDYHYYGHSYIRVNEEDGDGVNGTNAYNTVADKERWNYKGTLSVSGSHTPESGVHWLQNRARDWAYYGHSVYKHEDSRDAWFLVDADEPQEDYVGMHLIPNDFTVDDEIYIKAYDLSVYPKHITVVAQDQPADRNVTFPQCSFPNRFNLTASTVCLWNPDFSLDNPATHIPANEYNLTSNNNWVRYGSDENNVFDAAITAANPTAIFPYPDFGGNTVEGKHTIRIYMEDVISEHFGTPNSRTANYYFYNDVSLPHLVSWTPFSTIPIPGEYSTSSFSTVQARVLDPALRDGSPGSGLDLAECSTDIYVGLHDKSMEAIGGKIDVHDPFLGPQSDSLHGKTADVFRVFDIDQAVRDYHGWGESEYPLMRKSYVYETTVTINSGGFEITGLTNGESYMVGWKIESTRSDDGHDSFGARPVTPVTRNGYYFVNFFVADMVGNTGQIDSIDFNYMSAGGVITITADPHVILADGVSESIITTSPVHYVDSPGTVVMDGTLVTVSSSLGDIITPDASLEPGHQVGTVEGIATFVVRSRHSEAGKATLSARTVSGYANSGEVNDQLEIVLANMTDTRVEVKPAMEKMRAEYKIEGRVNSINNLVSGIDKIFLKFPEGTEIPAAAVLPNVILINNTPIPVASIVGQTLSFVMPVTLAVSALLEILIPEGAGLVNPASGHYNLEIHSTQNHGPVSMPYDILIFIPEAEVVPAPNPSAIGRVRFFFNLDGPARVELLVLNILGDKVSRVVEHYGEAKKGEVLDWNAQSIGPGVYWALVSIHYNDGRVVKIKKKKVVIIK